MTETPPVAGEPPLDTHEPDHVLDPVDAYRLLRAAKDARDAMIERYGLVGEAEHDIARELNDPRVLADPAAFPAAFRRALRSIEVLDRNGARQPTLPPLGPLAPLAKLVVTLVARWVVRGHQSRLIRDVTNLVGRREALAEAGSVELPLLRSARFHAQRLEQGYRPSPFGVPAFLIGGAVISVLTAGLEGLILRAVDSRLVGSIVAASVTVLLLGLAWCGLRAAGVARRRIRMSTDAAMNDLWAAVGSCGRPAQDQSFAFAVVAIVLTGAAIVAAPILTYLIIDG